jgi:hypothetical protein
LFMTSGLNGLMDEIKNQVSSAITDERMNSLYDSGLEFIKSKVRYLQNVNTSRWTVTTFSKNIQTGAIKKHGTDEDKTDVQERRVRVHRLKRTFLRGSNRSIGIRNRMIQSP